MTPPPSPSRTPTDTADEAAVLPSADAAPCVEAATDILRAASAVTSTLLPVLRRHGLTLTGFLVLHTLTLADGPMAPRDIARAQAIRPQTLSDVLQALERAGDVTRARERRDRRMLAVAITPAGRERYGRCHPPLDAAATTLFTALDDADLPLLRDLLAEVPPALATGRD